METTLASRSYLGLIRRWQAQGYHVGLIFLRLTALEIAIARVRVRVQQDGHHIPEDVIRRRFVQGWTNFQTMYRPAVSAWQRYDAQDPNVLLLEQGSNP